MADSEENTSEVEVTSSDEEGEDVSLIEEHLDLIEPGAIGIFVAGQPIPTDLPEGLKCRKSTLVVSEEGEEYEIPLKIVYSPIEDVLEIQIENNTSKEESDLIIMEMKLQSDFYKTKENIGVGSTIDEFMEAYPDHTIWYTYVSDRCVIETPELEGVQFVLDVNDLLEPVNWSSDMETLDAGEFKEGSKIKSVRVY